ncbi:GPP34 family phosphoprotein [Streptomyces sp. CHD11]|uniref:GOLPH3/VPS74 family protein n=1 Tax=Streptomyces sp. CHD11 TaxID=2741325 RepID=UPI001BFC41FD|nr:GPP34 family phosphoprotein [Streptomyces sp. CHD11]MBT3154346.1 GPP34 family phosphoprotein [Streptomyces sp. CHD11]
MLNGPLSPPARLCLLCWDTDPGRLAPLVRAGALAELARRGLLTDDDGIVTPLDLDSRTGDPVMDGLLELVSESFPHHWRSWVTLHARHTLDAVREQLVAEGVLRAEKHRVLGVFPSVDHVLADTARADALRREARSVLGGSVPAESVSGQTASLLALATAAGLPPEPGGPVGDRRAEALTRRAEASAPGFGAILRQLREGLADASPAPSPAPSPTRGR